MGGKGIHLLYFTTGYSKLVGIYSLIQDQTVGLAKIFRYFPSFLVRLLMVVKPPCTSNIYRCIKYIHTHVPTDFILYLPKFFLT
jgi:hypothetical protein